MARPKKAPAERRDHQFKVRTTAAEHAELADAAGRRGLNASEFMGRLFFDRRLPLAVADQQAQADLLIELNRHGVNLNQFTRAVNAGRLPSLDVLRTVLARHNALLDRLGAVMDRFA